MICIEKELVFGLLTEVSHSLQDIKAVPKKRLGIIMDNALAYLDLLQEIDTDALLASAQATIPAPDPEEWAAPETEMVEEMVPLVPYSSIGKPCFFCKNCKARVKQKDNYCRKCGFRFRKDGDDA